MQVIRYKPLSTTKLPTPTTWQMLVFLVDDLSRYTHRNFGRCLAKYGQTYWHKNML